MEKPVEPVVQRLVLAQDVTAAKYGSGAPVDDPACELTVLEPTAQGLESMEFYQPVVMPFFRDQIEADKVIQRELHHRWCRHSEEVPNGNRDLKAEAGPRLDRITTQVVRQLKCPEETRSHFRMPEIIQLNDKRCAATLSAGIW